MDLQRILPNVVLSSDGCWEWQKSTCSYGYGQIMEGRVYWSTHRYAYTCIHGAIPTDRIIRHLCHNRLCCNPDHLKVGTHKENWKDSEQVHKENSRKKAYSWIIGTSTYSSIREARDSTGITMKSLTKHSVKGVFNLDSYREGCRKANKKPKV